MLGRTSASLREDSMRISIIIPCLNEAQRIAETLQGLQPLRRRNHEIIVVDGGSEDTTAKVAKPLADVVIMSTAGRAVQLNTGATIAKGDVLLFLHADTCLPKDADKLIASALSNSGRQWGRFDTRLSGHGISFRIIERFMNIRSRLTSIATGDQALFVTRDLFITVGGFPEIALMEDIAVCRLLKRHGAPVCLAQRAITSSRRWEQRGVWRTVFLMWRLRIAYFFGADPQRLARLYQRV